MIQHLINNPAWRRKNRLWTFIGTIPVFGFMGFLIMGQRSGYKPFRRAGTVYGWLSMIALALLACCNNLIPGLIYARLDTYNATARLMDDVAIYSVILLVLLWIACSAHTTVSGNRFLQYLALAQVNRPAMHPLTQDKTWQRSNQGWRIWAWFPVTGGLAVYYAGCKLKSRKLRMGGVLAVVITVIAMILALIGSRISQYYRIVKGVYAVTNWYILSQWIICLLLSCHLKDRVMDALATRMEGDTRMYPLLGERKWRNANSSWRIWTWLPVVGGIGIALAGLQSKRIKVTANGVLFCFCSGLLFALRVCWNVVIEGLRELLSASAVSAIRFAGENIIVFLSIFLYLLILFYGILIRWDTLSVRAASLQGYRSEFERELDMQTRMRARKIDFASVPVQDTPKPEVVPVAPAAPAVVPEVVTTVSTTPDTPVDINHGTQAELMTLPGIGVVQAKQAIEYRTANNGFKSVDEFVEVLKVKPHFAVQIFARATLGQTPEADRKNVSEGSAVRRRIDF